MKLRVSKGVVAAHLAVALVSIIGWAIPAALVIGRLSRSEIFADIAGDRGGQVIGSVLGSVTMLTVLWFGWRYQDASVSGEDASKERRWFLAFAGYAVVAAAVSGHGWAWTAAGVTGAFVWGAAHSWLVKSLTEIRAARRTQDTGAAGGN